jgi:hypothetical protein
VRGRQHPARVAASRYFRAKQIPIVFTAVSRDADLRLRLDDGFSFAVPTTTDSLVERRDALVADVLEQTLFGMNWADRAGISSLENLVRSGYKYNFRDEFAKARGHRILDLVDSQLQVRPGASNLLGVLVTQIAHAMARSDESPACANCKTTFPPKRRLSRGSRQYCPACRKAKVPQRDASRDWRRRTGSELA